jgi:DNA ligase-1
MVSCITTICATNFNTLISIVKKQKPSATELQISASKMQFHVYDMYDITQPTMEFEERYMKMLELVQELEGIVPVKTFKVDTEAELDQMYEKFLEEGYEGIMVRSNAPYQQKRTVNLLKRKEFIDGEYLITDIVEGVGNRSGMMGKIIMVTDDGESFEADGSGLGGHDAYVEMLANKEHYIGLMATVKYQNLTPNQEGAQVR